MPQLESPGPLLVGGGPPGSQSPGDSGLSRCSRPARKGRAPDTGFSRAPVVQVLAVGAVTYGRTQPAPASATQPGPDGLQKPGGKTARRGISFGGLPTTTASSWCERSTIARGFPRYRAPLT